MKNTMELTWASLVQLEPKLGRLLDEAQRHKDNGVAPEYCANAIWFGWRQFDGHGIKERLCELVGWERVSKANVGVLGTSEAYDIAYETIYDALPNCRHAGVICG